jgi:hypothetical protein
MSDIKTRAREIAFQIDQSRLENCGEGIAWDEDEIAIIESALLSAQNEAYEKAAKVAEDKGRHKSLRLHIESFGPHAGEVQDRGRVYIDEPFKSIATAIRSLKGE